MLLSIKNIVSDDKSLNQFHKDLGRIEFVLDNTDKSVRYYEKVLEYLNSNNLEQKSIRT